ncbi:MAG: NAD(P)-dependent oxidoreductase, partial [Pseudomonadota bacterium]
MRYFPIFVDTADQSIVVIGGNEQAAQKLRLLRKTEARLHVVAREAVPEIVDLARRGTIEWRAREFDITDLDGCRLIYAAADDDDVLLERVSRLAQARHIPVNIVDRPELSTFITPAIVDRDPVVCAIGSEGTAPVLVRRIREILENLLPAGLGLVARRAGEIRPWLADKLTNGRDRRRFWDGFFDGPIAQRILQGESVDLTAELDAKVHPPEESGRVLLVGAGPGDPDLLTLKAMRALQIADVIVHDRLVGPGILERARRDAERIDVGKSPGRPSPKQDEICAILVDQAR